MADRTFKPQALISPALAAALRFGGAALLAGLLAACASGPVETTNVFADPAKYALYECKQLEPVRATAVARIDELRRLMAKAGTGPGGGVMAEIGYRPELTRAQADLASANSAWERNRCGPLG